MRPLEDLTATLLQRLLGRYITGLEGRNLRVAVWSGRVVLENLHLRPDALLGMLPVGVRAGFVGRIEMSVPWHKLGSSPVSLELHNVFVLAMPLNEAGWTPEDVSSFHWVRKQATLRAQEREVQELLERLCGAAGDDDGEAEPAEASASATLLARGLDNVQLTICNLHVRYEDRMNAGSPCALGLRLAAMHMRSVDEHGRPRFVERLPGQRVSKMVEARWWVQSAPWPLL